MRTALTAKNDRCSIARTLEVIGPKWTLLVIREAMWGRTRFAEFRERLGIAPDVLADRLATLVDEGLLEREEYRSPGQREREQYVLTDAGRALIPVMAALAAWGDEYRPTGHGPAAVYTDESTGEPVHLEFCTAGDRRVDTADVTVIRGPGSLAAASV